MTLDRIEGRKRILVTDPN